MIQSWKQLRFLSSPAHEFLLQKISADGEKVIPNEKLRMKAFSYFRPAETKAVILGQDPYPNRKHAMGLAFSVWPDVRPLPRTLTNIFKEYVNDLGLPLPRTGDLTGWAHERVLLLNTCLTTVEGKTHAHRNLGWEKLAVEVVSRLSERGRCVFILWGKHAGEYRGLINEDTNVVISSSHPSPLSARHGFFGSRPFSTCNLSLVRMGVEPINWRLR